MWLCIIINVFIIIPTRCTNFTNLFWHKNDMFQTVPLSIIRRAWPCSKAVYKPVLRIPLLSVQRINFWWWTAELSKTCRVSCQNKIVKLVHLVGFITKKFVTMHGHTNVKYLCSVCALLVSSPVTGLEWPRGFQEVKVPRFHDNGTGWW
jgi:hypothetical protein